MLIRILQALLLIVIQTLFLGMCYAHIEVPASLLSIDPIILLQKKKIVCSLWMPI